MTLLKRHSLQRTKVFRMLFMYRLYLYQLILRLYHANVDLLNAHDVAGAAALRQADVTTWVDVTTQGGGDMAVLECGGYCATATLTDTNLMTFTPPPPHTS